MVIDRCNSVCDHQKASFMDHNDHQYLDVTTIFKIFDSFATST